MLLKDTKPVAKLFYYNPSQKKHDLQYNLLESYFSQKKKTFYGNGWKTFPRDKWFIDNVIAWLYFTHTHNTKKNWSSMTNSVK